MPKSIQYRLAREKTGGRIDSIIRAERSKGLSYDEIARRLFAAHQVEISGNTLRTWARELGIEAEPQEVAS